jgi:hypothetical protein
MAFIVGGIYFLPRTDSRRLNLGALTKRKLNPLVIEQRMCCRLRCEDCEYEHCAEAWTWLLMVISATYALGSACLLTAVLIVGRGWGSYEYSSAIVAATINLGYSILVAIMLSIKRSMFGRLRAVEKNVDLLTSHMVFPVQADDDNELL